MREILHRASVKLWCIHGYKWYNFEGLLPIIRTKEGKFLSV